LTKFAIIFFFFFFIVVVLPLIMVSKDLHMCDHGCFWRANSVESIPSCLWF